MNFDPREHAYVTHHTFTGKQCAMCGRPESEHAAKAAQIGELKKPTKAGDMKK